MGLSYAIAKYVAWGFDTGDVPSIPQSFINTFDVSILEQKSWARAWLVEDTTKIERLIYWPRIIQI